ncbi:MAG: T9SS type A sorting domain-containing protein, partial [Bacteroidia bacterium]|nr:T9SS type A sorting domain-containing protein [Bacteroidia bacterium]
IVLPIELLEFNAVKNSTAVDVSWITESEKDCDYFLVERSVDAINFETIGKIKGTGTSELKNNYLLKDERPLNGISYYRLKQFDFNGKFSYSKIVSVNFDYGNKLSVFNQHVSNDNLIFSVSCACKKPVMVDLYNLTGQKIWSSQNEISSGIINVSIPVNSFSHGIYLLKVSDGNETVTRKLSW